MHNELTEFLCKELKARKQTSQKPNKKIEYNGEMLLLGTIAKHEDVDPNTLKRNYEKTGNIYEAVKKCKQNRKPKKERKEYKGKQRTLGEIAKIEKVDGIKLTKNFNDTKEIHRAVFATKYEAQKNQKIEIRGFFIDLYDMSILIGISYRDLINLLNSGENIGQIKEKQVRGNFAEKLKMDNKEVLLEFCIEKKLDFTFIYRAVATYGKQLDEAVLEYEKGNREIPINWIYAKYEKTLCELGFDRMQTTAIVNDLHKNNMSLEEAMEMCIIRKVARKNSISPEWGDTLYTLSRGRKLLGEEFRQEIQLNENETNFIEECEWELSEVKRKMQESIDGQKNKRDDDEQDL